MDHLSFILMSERILEKDEDVYYALAGIAGVMRDRHGRRWDEMAFGMLCGGRLSGLTLADLEILIHQYGTSADKDLRLAASLIAHFCSALCRQYNREEAEECVYSEYYWMLVELMDDKNTELH